jgi:hypothetical protein
MKKLSDDKKLVLVEIVKMIFEFLIFRWGKGYARFNNVCGDGKSADSCGDLLETNKDAFRGANETLRHTIYKDKD